MRFFNILLLKIALGEHNVKRHPFVSTMMNCENQWHDKNDLDLIFVNGEEPECVYTYEEC